MASFELSGSTLKVSGVLDGDAESVLRSKLQKLAATGAQVVELNLTKVESITSICIGALVASWIDLNDSKRSMKLSASAPVKRVLDMTGLTSVLMKIG
jgi:anti-anti-sigma factor